MEIVKLIFSDTESKNSRSRALLKTIKFRRTTSKIKSVVSKTTSSLWILSLSTKFKSPCGSKKKSRLNFKSRDALCLVLFVWAVQSRMENRSPKKLFTNRAPLSGSNMTMNLFSKFAELRS